MQSRPARRGGTPVGPWLAPLVVGIIVASTIVVGFGPPGYLLPKTCQIGKELGTYLTWTPIYLVNIPDGGSVSVWQDSWNYVMQSGSVNLTSPAEISGSAEQSWPPGSGIFVTFEETNWTIYETENVTPSGLTASPCTQPYVGDFGNPYGDCSAWPDLPLVNNSTDAVEPHSWNGTWSPACPATSSGTYVWFNTTFLSSGSGYGAPAKLDLCGMTGTYTLAAYTPVRAPVTITVPYGGKEIESHGYLTWQGVRSVSNEATVTYNLPMGWNWEVSPIWPVGSPLDLNVSLNQLVAFERFAC